MTMCISCGGHSPCWPATLTGSAVILEWHVIPGPVLPPSYCQIVIKHDEGIAAGSRYGDIWRFVIDGEDEIPGVCAWAEWPHDVGGEHPSSAAYGAE